MSNQRAKSQESRVKKAVRQTRDKQEKKIVVLSKAELESAVRDEVKKRQKMELELKLGKLKKLSDLIACRRKIAQLLTESQERRAKSEKR